MMQQDQSDDYVLATGQNHTIREFVEKAFQEVGINIQWKGQDIHEVGYNQATGEILIKIDPKFFRPTEVTESLGDSSYAKEKLNWKLSISFDQLIKEMVMHDCIKT